MNGRRLGRWASKVKHLYIFVNQVIPILANNLYPLSIIIFNYLINSREGMEIGLKYVTGSLLIFPTSNRLIVLDKQAQKHFTSTFCHNCPFTVRSSLTVLRSVFTVRSR